MEAIILAAGVARRLYPLTLDIPKCLLEVGGKPIIDYQLDAMKAQGITDVTIVVGYHRDKLEDHLSKSYTDMIFSFVINHHFFETNTAFSLSLCGNVLRNSGVLLMNGDVLYPRELLARVLKSEHENVLAVEVKSCGKEEVKVIEGENGKITSIGKELIEENSLGEFIGVARLSSGFSRSLAGSLDKLVAAGGRADYFEAGMEPLLVEHEVFYADVSDLPCIEIDFREDLEQAQELAQSGYY